MKSMVLVRVDVEGFHQYDEAPKQVAFLSARHRHCFSVTAAMEVSDLNRQVEIFMVRASLLEFFRSRWKVPDDLEESCDRVAYGSPIRVRPFEFGGRSCEMIAAEVLEHWRTDTAWVEVWEENTGGARVER